MGIDTSLIDTEICVLLCTIFVYIMNLKQENALHINESHDADLKKFFLHTLPGTHNAFFNLFFCVCDSANICKSKSSDKS